MSKTWDAYHKKCDFYVYCITNIVNNKRYIGLSMNLFSRWNCHLSSLRSRTHENAWLQKDFNRYGERVFLFTVLETTYATRKQAMEIEWWWMKHYKTYTEENGYNASDMVCKTYTGELKPQSVKGNKIGYRIHDTSYIENKISSLELTNDYISGFCHMGVGGFEKVLKQERYISSGEVNRMCECLQINKPFKKWLFERHVYSPVEKKE